MTTRHRAIAASVPSFGRRERAFVLDAEQPVASAFSDDLRLFMLTFAGGFLFVSVYLA
ncbi:MAG: hypothetical protein M3Q88_05850 [Pseudomonadota bacterium]|nr:hypothetical protein [Pseudomonadota bacterium]